LSEKIYRILAVNPGSTSTKIALFDNDLEVFAENLRHDSAELHRLGEIQDQLCFRRDIIESTVVGKGYKMEDIDVFVGRGGGLLSLAGGTYKATDLLVDHASRGMSGQHPAQLAAQICRQFSDKFGKQAFVVNPPDVDEFEEISRVAGLRDVYRESHIHALNQKEIGIRYAASKGKKYEDLNLVICHLGGGISITAHKKGRMIDSNDIIKGSGPMTPTRAGDLAYTKVIDLAYSGRYTKAELTDRLNKNGGLTDIFGTADTREVKRRGEEGDRHAKIVYDAFIYQNAKYAGAMAVALQGKVDAIILTGGISHDEYFTGKMSGYLSWIAEIVVMPGEFELEALASGALRVMRGEETAKKYTGVPVWNGF
jgi:butyrate kinase